MKNKGFTILELLLVLSLIAIISAVTFPFFLSSQTSTNLRTHAQTIKQALRIAEQKAISGQEASEWGVYFDDQNKKYILYKGISYSSRDSNFDREYEYPEALTVSTDFGDNIYFNLNSGIPSTNGTTTISSYNDEMFNVVITSFGLIQLN